MDIIKHLNWVDVLAIILVFRISYVAFYSGFTHEIFPLLGNVVVIAVSLRYYVAFAHIISMYLFNMPSQLANFISFLVLTLLISFIFKILGSFLEKILKMQWHSIIESAGGLIIGIMRGCLTVSLILIILSLTPLPYFQRSIRDKSLTGMYFVRIGPGICGKLSRFLPTIKVGEPSLNDEQIVKDLVSDKSIAPQVRRERKKAPEYEM